MDELKNSSRIAISGMNVQTRRMRVISENMANADSLPQTPGAEAYRRKTITFKSELDRTTGANLVRVDRVGRDESPLDRKYDPSHPGADAQGYVMMPNVNPLIELMDLREAQRSYEANLNVVNTSKHMLSRTLDLLR